MTIIGILGSRDEERESLQITDNVSSWCSHSDVLPLSYIMKNRERQIIFPEALDFTFIMIDGKEHTFK